MLFASRHSWPRAALQPTGEASDLESGKPPIPADASLRLQEILAVSAVRLKHVVAFDAIAFYFWRDNALRAEFVMGEDYHRLLRLRVPAGEGLIGWVAEVGKPIINGNPAVEPGFMNDHRGAPILDCTLALPLAHGQEKPGVVALCRASKNRFTADDLANLLPLCHSLARVLTESQPDSANLAA